LTIQPNPRRKPR